ncbi:MAG: hypothetical protein DCC68_21290 [Planctomycetota bacterium]|nr:MAG: hypothetical protein DCC68_21290 [Planctomycetota bacterium]
MDSILSVKGTAERGADYQFRVAMTDGKVTVECTVTAAELTTYSGFQRAVLSRYGVYFRNDDFEASRGRGAAAWRDEVEWQLSRKSAEVATR